MKFEFQCPFTPEELEKVKQDMIEQMWDSVTKRYPNLRLATLETNLALFWEIHKYDKQCPNCLSVQQCPTQDGNRMYGELMPDGTLHVYMSPCPHGYKPTRHSEYEPQQPARKWGKRE
jgi:hypothetical protein